jgi:hypothetical protein
MQKLNLAGAQPHPSFKMVACARGVDDDHDCDDDHTMTATISLPIYVSFSDLCMQESLGLALKTNYSDEQTHFMTQRCLFYMKHQRNIMMNKLAS